MTTCMQRNLRYAVARCGDLREVVAVAWNRADSADPAPCELCRTRDWMRAQRTMR